MTQYEDEPFQMDEEVGEEIDEGDLPSELKYKNPDFTRDISPMDVNGPRLRTQLNNLHINGGPIGLYDVEGRISDGFNADNLSNDILNERALAGDEKQEFEEDLDDKLDVQKQLELEKQARSNKLDIASQEVTPPENFAPVINHIYRSSFPQIQSFSFLRSLKLKSILCLIPEEYPEMHKEFFEEEGIKLFQMGMSGNKEPFVKIPHDLVTEAVKVVLDPKNQPILIHCNRGKHRTGCVVGVIRRLQRWLLTIIFDEYRKFAAPKERPMDQQFIELYNETEIEKYAYEHGLLPLKWD